MPHDIHVIVAVLAVLASAGGTIGMRDANKMHEKKKKNEKHQPPPPVLGGSIM